MTRTALRGGGTRRPRAGPMFSVLMATYNHARYIPEALDSVAAQSFVDYEIVIVDDGSTDETVAVVCRWIDDFSERRANRVLLLTQPNGGQSAALEHGIGACTGRYVSLLDSDDRWLPSKLEAVHRLAAEQPQAVMICHPVRVMGPTGVPTSRLRPSRARLAHGDLREQIRRTGRTVAAVTSGVTVRSDVLRDLLPMPTKGFAFGADGYITTGASLRGPVAVVPEPFALYRIHPTGQYVRRMLSEDGPRLAMAFHRVVARHFGLEESLARSSYFTRYAFADAKLHAGCAEQLRAYGRLLRATVKDGAFSPAARGALTALWTAALMSPRPLFLQLWQWLQLRHTGLDRALAATAFRRNARPSAADRSAPRPAGPRMALQGPRLAAYGLLGVTVHAMTVDDLYAVVEHAVRCRERCVIGNHNLHSVHLYHRDEGMRRFYEASRYVFIDGMPIVFLGRLLGLPLRRDHRFTSIDWVRPFMRHAAERGWRVFLLGSRPGIPECAAGRLRQEAPGLQVATAHGYFDARAGSPESEAVLARIRQLRPHVLIVGMGMPRQEQWIIENRARIEANVIMNLGALMDYLAGVVPTPPRWLGRVGFEWLYRLGSEPRRLWRRYLVEPWSLLPLIAGEVAKRLAGGRSDAWHSQI